MTHEKVKEIAKKQAQDQKLNLSFLFETQNERLKRLDAMVCHTIDTPFFYIRIKYFESRIQFLFLILKI